MSTSYNVYVGPYISIFNPERDAISEYYSCPNEKCIKHKIKMSEKFCPQCGSNVLLIQVPCKRRILFSASDEFNDKLWDCNYYHDNDHSYILPNQKFLERQLYFYIESEQKAYEFDALLTNSELIQFRNKYDEEITKIIKIFGAPNVNINWGVVTYVS